MCLCYILAFGALEYMIESLIRGWVQSNVRKHRHPYPGKIKVDLIIGVLNDLAEFNLKHNNAIRYDRICPLIERLTGASNKARFTTGVSSFAGGGCLVSTRQ